MSGGREREVLIPPTYVGYRPKADVVRTDIAEMIAPHGYRVVATRLPEMTLAVCSGLARYGRNNIIYTPGLAQPRFVGAHAASRRDRRGGSRLPPKVHTFLPRMPSSRSATSISVARRRR